MTRRTTLLLFCTAAAGLLAVAPVLRWTEEPRHGGRTLDDWLAQMQLTSGTQKEQSRQAVRSIGTNAVPYLLKYVRYESGRARRRLGTMLEHAPLQIVGLRRRWADPERFREMGVEGFRALGEAAVGAVPELEKQLNHGPHPASAAAALAGIGPATLPVLMNAVRSELPETRRSAVVALGHLGSAAYPAVPILLELYQNQADPGTRAVVKNELLYIDSELFLKLARGVEPAELVADFRQREAAAAAVQRQATSSLPSNSGIRPPNQSAAAEGVPGQRATTP